jgi:hypothetical protein
MEDTDAELAPGSTIITKTLSDAFEGKGYGSYMWRSDPVKKYWEVRPFVCSVKLPSGEEKACTSTEEFDELAKYYME